MHRPGANKYDGSMTATPFLPRLDTVRRLPFLARSSVDSGCHDPGSRRPLHQNERARSTSPEIDLLLGPSLPTTTAPKTRFACCTIQHHSRMPME